MDTTSTESRFPAPATALRKAAALDGIDLKEESRFPAPATALRKAAALDGIDLKEESPCSRAPAAGSGRRLHAQRHSDGTSLPAAKSLHPHCLRSTAYLGLPAGFASREDNCR